MTPEPSEWEQALAEARELFLRESGGRLEAMARLLQRLAREPGDRRALEELRRHFHAFAGSGETYGFPRVSVLGQRGETECGEADSGVTAVAAQRVAGWHSLVSSIRAALGAGSGAPAPVSAAPAEGRQPRRVLIVDDDASLLSTLRQLVAQEGYEVVAASSLDEARAKLQPLPHGMLVDVVLPDGSGYELVEHVRALARGDETAILMVSARKGLLDKVQAVHCGADGYFEKPLELEVLTRRLHHLLARFEPAPGRVLAVEDDPAQARFVRTVLESAGYLVEVCPEPERFEALLSATAPDLVLMDVGLPGLSGYDLVRLLRQDERHAALPIVFLTTAGSLQDQVEAARAGGDAHLLKPVAPGLLLSTVAARIERARLLRSLLRQDGLTRLLTHAAFLERAREVWARASRDGTRPSVWVMIDLDHFKTINDRHGHPVGDRVLASLAALLRRRLRHFDALGRYGGEEFALLLEDLSEDEAVRLVERLLEEFRAVEHVASDGSSFHASFSAGVAELRPDTAGIDTWRQQADDALYAAKQAGRSRVQGSLAGQPRREGS